jgi:pimeloyl-ACP methyl ester carboxylesterase
MKRITILGLLILLVLWSASTSLASPPAQEPGEAGNPQERDEPLPPLGTAGIVPAPQADDTHFVANSGPYMDRYLFRKDVPNGRLTFDIPITRYYFNSRSINFINSDGSIKPDYVDDFVALKLLPATAVLKLHVFDVDEEAPSPYCPEVDHIYVNGQQIIRNGKPAKLSGANETWSLPHFVVPISALRFPTAKGLNGQRPTPKLNQIAIDIDTQCFDRWAVQVDWGMIEIPSPIRPLMYVHGWTGSVTDFASFQSLADQDGIPSAVPVNLEEGIYPFQTTSAYILALAIDSATQEFGVDKVNLFAHSKGGVVARHLLGNEAFAKKVEHLITFGSPHHGTDWLRQIGAKIKCNKYVYNAIKKRLCIEAAEELSEDNMRRYNYSACIKQTPWSEWEGCQLNVVPSSFVEYLSFVGNHDPVTNEKTGTYPWKANKKPYPTEGNVDQEFNCGNILSNWDCHGKIIQMQQIYQCAISQIDPRIYSSSICPGFPTATSVVVTNVSETPAIPNEDYQSIFEATGNLSAGGNITLFATIDTVEQVVFNVFTTSELASFTLQNLGGNIITPTTAGVLYYATQQDSSLWLYQYSINTPAAGTWQLRLNALNAIDYSSNVMVKSNTKLQVKTNKHTYNHNELVTVEASLANNTTPLSGSTINLLVTRPDNSTLTSALVDSGSNGDVTANDGIYTTQFNSSTVTGHHRLSLSAVNGQVNRLDETSIAVTPQTARIQSVTSATPIDTNSNGLYDQLRLNLSLNVLTAGHFEVTGTLVDPTGNPVVSTAYATLRDGSGPLSAGTRTIPLTFSGSAIREHGVNGPYKLTNVIIEDQNISSLQVAFAQNVYTSAAYRANQFEGPLVTLAGGNENLIDTNGNSLHDILRINLNVTVLNPGTYELNGRLVDPNGDEIAWDKGTFTASSSGTFVGKIEFDGKSIREHGVNGPYALKDLVVANTTGLGSKIVDQAYTTQAYSYIQFELVPEKVFLPTILRNFASNAQPAGFDSQFNGSAVGWQPHSGNWNVDSNYYSTTGTSASKAWATSSFTTNFANFDYQAKLQRSGCSLCANQLIIRGTPTPLRSDNLWHSFYIFQYNADGAYSVWKGVAGGSLVALQNWTSTSAVVKGSAWNTLRVVANGTRLYFYINGILVWTGSDSGLNSGRVGIGMYRDTSTGDRLLVDWAKLSTLSTSELSALEVHTINPEQQALNEAANQRESSIEEIGQPIVE